MRDTHPKIAAAGGRGGPVHSVAAAGRGVPVDTGAAAPHRAQERRLKSVQGGGAVPACSPCSASRVWRRWHCEQSREKREGPTPSCVFATVWIAVATRVVATTRAPAPGCATGTSDWLPRGAVVAHRHLPSVIPSPTIFAFTITVTSFLSQHGGSCGCLIRGDGCCTQCLLGSFGEVDR